VWGGVGGGDGGGRGANFERAGVHFALDIVHLTSISPSMPRSMPLASAAEDRNCRSGGAKLELDRIADGRQGRFWVLKREEGTSGETTETR
jgi:hypothetical protein